MTSFTSNSSPTVESGVKLLLGYAYNHNFLLFLFVKDFQFLILFKDFVSRDCK